MTICEYLAVACACATECVRTNLPSASSTQSSRPASWSPAGGFPRFQISFFCVCAIWVPTRPRLGACIPYKWSCQCRERWSQRVQTTRGDSFACPECAGTSPTSAASLELADNEVKKFFKIPNPAYYLGNTFAVDRLKLL